MVTVITGATKGIGRALALRFASEHHHMAITSRSKTDLDILETELKGLFPDIVIFAKAADFSDVMEVKSFAADVINYFGQVDVLINNVGLFKGGEILSGEDEVMHTMMQVNFFSAYHLTRSLISHIPSNGHIFNMCSIASKVAYPTGGAYCISKFALYGFSKVLREELKPKGIKVTAILPGATWTESWSGMDVPRERLMEAEEIAKSVWAAYDLGPSAVVEEIILRPMAGDL